MGAPQTDTPQQGKVGCGNFVGLVLSGVGFRVDNRKLRRQPSQMIIASFVSKKRTQKFSNAPNPVFWKKVRAMGPGLYIIGLDYHVGLLIQTKTEVRFIHSSVVTGMVVNEDATQAELITDSRFKMVGKILSPQNINDWLAGRTIKVKGRF